MDRTRFSTRGRKVSGHCEMNGHFECADVEQDELRGPRALKLHRRFIQGPQAEDTTTRQIEIPLPSPKVVEEEYQNELPDDYMEALLKDLHDLDLQSDVIGAKGALGQAIHSSLIPKNDGAVGPFPSFVKASTLYRVEGVAPHSFAAKEE